MCKTQRTLTLCTMLATAICVPAQTSKKVNPPATSQVVTIPKDAVKNADGTYSYTDKQGKKWIYANSPFGVIKSAASDSPDKAAAAKPADAQTVIATKAIDNGDTVKFERPTPFGTMKWEKKKTELNEEERHLFETQNPAQEAKPDAK
jgi:hypothetical protein